MMFYRLIVLAAICFASASFAQGDSAVVHRAIELRSLDADRIAAWKADPVFDYDRDIRRLPSLWEQLKEWVWEWLQTLIGRGAAGLISSNLLYILIALILGFALHMLSKGGLRRVFHGAPRSLGEVAVVDQDIREMDLGAMITEAEAAGDLRRAIRLHYLLVLRKLVDQGVLHWGPEHTDRDYMAQITEPTLRSRFTHVALVFQYVWYGHSEVDPARYPELRKPFTEFETVPVA